MWVIARIIDPVVERRPEKCFAGRRDGARPGELRNLHGLQTCRHFDQHATHRKVADDDLLDSIKRRPELAGAVESNVRPTVAWLIASGHGDIEDTVARAIALPHYPGIGEALRRTRGEKVLPGEPFGGVTARGESLAS